MKMMIEIASLEENGFIIKKSDLMANER